MKLPIIHEGDNTLDMIVYLEAINHSDFVLYIMLLKVAITMINCSASCSLQLDVFTIIFD